MAGLLDKHLIYVTGKGGVGKTTVSAALGLAAAAAGRRTIVCEVAQQERVSRAFQREGVQREVEVQLADGHAAPVAVRRQGQRGSHRRLADTALAGHDDHRVVENVHAGTLR